MAKELKVYGGSYDGRNRYIVAAYTKKAAWEALRDRKVPVNSFSTWNKFTSVTGNPTELETALPYPGVVFFNRRNQPTNGYEVLK
jgi:hypothetical protein